jgi:hypothetical protein
MFIRTLGQSRLIETRFSIADRDAKAGVRRNYNRRTPVKALCCFWVLTGIPAEHSPWPVADGALCTKIAPRRLLIRRTACCLGIRYLWVAREDHRVTSGQMRFSYLNGIATGSHIALRLSNRCNPHLFAKKSY